MVVTTAGPPSSWRWISQRAWSRSFDHQRSVETVISASSAAGVAPAMLVHCSRAVHDLDARFEVELARRGWLAVLVCEEPHGDGRDRHGSHTAGGPLQGGGPRQPPEGSHHSPAVAVAPAPVVRRFLAGGEAELPEDLADVPLCAVEGDPEGAGDLAVRLALDQEVEDAALAFVQFVLVSFRRREVFDLCARHGRDSPTGERDRHYPIVEMLKAYAERLAP